MKKCSTCGAEVIGPRKTCEKCKNDLRFIRVKEILANRERRIAKRSRACIICGASFIHPISKKKQFTCSRPCAAKLTASKRTQDRETRACKQCGKEFVERVGRYKIFCSKKCNGLSCRKTVEAKCSFCGKEILIRPSGKKKYLTGKKYVLPEPKKNFCSRPCHVAWQKQTKKKSQFENPKKIIYRKVKSFIRSALRLNKERAGFKKLFGYSKDELRRHIADKFLPGMSFENYGEWHLDHIIPISKHNFETVNDVDFKRCWSLKNLQPLWAKDNLRKTDTLSKPFQPYLTI